MRKYDISSSEICRVHSSPEFLFSTCGRGFIGGNFPLRALYLIFWDAVTTLCNQIADVRVTYVGRTATTTLWVTTLNVIACRTLNVWRNTVLLDTYYKKLGLGMTHCVVRFYFLRSPDWTWYDTLRGKYWNTVLILRHQWLKGRQKGRLKMRFERH